MKSLALALGALFLAHAAYADDAPASAPAKDYVILKVGGDEIKKSEMDNMLKIIAPGSSPAAFDALDQATKDNVLRGIASEHVLLKQAEKDHIADQPDVKARLAEADHQILIRELISEKTKAAVSDAKLKAAYDDRVKQLSPENTKPTEEVHARHILIKVDEGADKKTQEKAEKEAKDIERKLKHGGNFETLAKEKSEDKVSGAEGGDLGWFTADKMVPSFSKAAFALKKGEISAPVKTEFGWHIIQVTDRRSKAPVIPTFDQMKEGLQQELAGKAIGDYVTDLMKDQTLTAYDASGQTRSISAVPPKQDGSDKTPGAK